MMMSLCHLKWGLFNENIYVNVNVDFYAVVVKLWQ